MTHLATLASGMENIGRNCEFGLVQRKFGADPIGLLRFSGTPMTGLIDALSNGFEGLAETMTGKADPPNMPPEQQEWWLTCSRYDILFHSGQNVAATTVEAATFAIRSRLRWLARKLISDLEEGAKLFVFSDAEARSPLDALPLIAAMRAIGPAQLLFVLPGAATRGWAYRVNDALTAGFIPKLTEVGDAVSFDESGWRDVIVQVAAIQAKADRT